MKKTRKLLLITIILMTIVEVISILYLKKVSLRQTFIDAKINFTLVYILEVITYLVICISTILTGITTNKKMYSLNNKLYIIFILVMFFLIAFFYLTYGNFINSIIFLVFNNILRTKNKWNQWFHFFVVKVSLINYNLNIEG